MLRHVTHIITTEPQRISGVITHSSSRFQKTFQQIVGWTMEGLLQN